MVTVNTQAGYPFIEDMEARGVPHVHIFDLFLKRNILPVHIMHGFFSAYHREKLPFQVRLYVRLLCERFGDMWIE